MCDFHFQQTFPDSATMKVNYPMPKTLPELLDHREQLLDAMDRLLATIRTHWGTFSSDPGLYGDLIDDYDYAEKVLYL